MGASDLDMLSVTMMDVRATVESMRRSVTSAQADVERLRHGVDADVIADLRRCLDALATETTVVQESLATLRPHFQALQASAADTRPSR